MSSDRASGSARSLEHHPLHLGPGGRAAALPPFTDAAWFADYETAHGADGAEGRLVSLHRFTADWDGWEMHPLGDEVVICIAGTATLIQQHAQGQETRIALAPGDHAINPPGIWHTADVDTHASLIFITVGTGTQTRPR